MTGKMSYIKANFLKIYGNVTYPVSAKRRNIIIVA
jgi:hypothetical protein